MKKLLSVCVTACVLAALPASSAWANPQQERMKACNQQAKEKALKGDERKAFMSSCLSGKSEGAAATGQPAQSAQSAQRERMKTCNQEATGKTLKGNERKAFMSDCLKKG